VADTRLDFLTKIAVSGELLSARLARVDSVQRAANLHPASERLFDRHGTARESRRKQFAGNRYFGEEI